jgi:uncharacterized membrane protein
MSQSHTGDPETAKEPSLPRRDWILLPLISLLTIVFCFVTLLSLAKWLYPSSNAGLERCFGKAGPNDATATPNSVCSERIVESKFVAEYRFNRCGHRADMECGPKPPGTYRIVMIGSSMALGLFVPREMTFAALLPAELSRQTGRKIELYNEATGGEYRGGPFPTPTSPLHFKEVLSEDPNLILWIVTPGDIHNMAPERSQSQQIGLPQVAETTPRGSRVAIAWEKVRAAIVAGTVMSKLQDHWDKTTASLMLKHLLYGSESQDEYVQSYLKNEDDAGFLKTEPGGKWRESLSIFNICAAKMEQQATAAGVPFVAVLAPNRAQAAMISVGEWPADYDPYKLDEEVRAIIESHGGIYIDILPDFRAVPNPERHYFPVDGHPDAAGHAMIAGMLAKELTSGAVPALKASPVSQSALSIGK